MKKEILQHRLFAFVLVCLLQSVATNTLCAQTHLLGLWVEAGEWSLLPYGSQLNNSIGGAGGVGFAYEIQQKHFLFQTGIGAVGGYTSFGASKNSDASTVILKNTMDPDGELFNYHYIINDRRDSYYNVTAQIPVLFGGQWKRFYFLAGVKMGLNIYSGTAVNCLLSSEGHYNVDGTYKYDIFRDMPDLQFFTNKEVTKTNSVNFNLDIDGSVELGVRLGYIRPATGFDVPKSRTQYRLAVFADYGLLDIHKAAAMSAIETPLSYNRNDMISEVKVNDILSTSNAASSVHNLFVGVKFTVLFELPEKGKCVICKDYNRSFRSKGRTQIIKD